MKNNLILENLSDLSVIVNSKIGLLRDDSCTEIDAIEKWFNGFLNQTEKESKVKKEICYAREESTELELHHIAGRKHDFRTITACKKCHIELSNMQKIGDSRWYVSNLPENLRKGFFLLGLYQILVLKAKKTGNSAYTELSIKYVEDISKLLRGTQND